MQRGDITIRPMERRDTEAVATLSGELGYPTTMDEMVRRVERVRSLASAQPAEILVAEDFGSRMVLGWVHVCIPAMLVSEEVADIWGLVVASSYRGGGVGRALMAAAEEWAVGRGCDEVRLKSNVRREEAHAFYRRLGYQVSKSQYTFSRTGLRRDYTTQKDQ